MMLFSNYKSIFTYHSFWFWQEIPRDIEFIVMTKSKMVQIRIKHINIDRIDCVHV